MQYDSKASQTRASKMTTKLANGGFYSSNPTYNKKHMKKSVDEENFEFMSYLMGLLTVKIKNMIAHCLLPLFMKKCKNATLINIAEYFTAVKAKIL